MISFLFFPSLPISATQCLCLLLFTCLLALTASLPALDIKNLHLLNGTLDEIMNVPPESSQLGKYITTVGSSKQGRVQSDPTQTSTPAQPRLCDTEEELNTALCVDNANAM